LSFSLQGEIDARSSRPPVKEHEADCEKRRSSTENHKTKLGTEKKKEKKKHIARQALEQRQAQARRKGRPEEDLPDEDDDDEDDDDDSEGMGARLD
jgi:hypothetical protein